MLWVFAKDFPGNCFPSSHVFFATLGALLVSRREPRRAVRVATWALAVAVCITTITSGQHYLIDIPGGAAAALFGYTVGRKLTPAK
jgi:membrane-associated phospholipid phosphatase